MPRVRSDDYETKAQSILDSAAAQFAKAGYPGTKMEDIAKGCGATKSMLYHYFQTKDDVLFAMLKEHLETMIGAFELALAEEAKPQAQFARLLLIFTQKTAQTRRRHIVAMNDIKYLPKARQAPILDLERRFESLAASVLGALNPKLDPALLKPYTLLLVGMLVWLDTWYKPSGDIKPDELTDRVSRLFLRGFLAEK